MRVRMKSPVRQRRVSQEDVMEFAARQEALAGKVAALDLLRGQLAAAMEALKSADALAESAGLKTPGDHDDDDDEDLEMTSPKKNKCRPTLQETPRAMKAPPKRKASPKK